MRTVVLRLLLAAALMAAVPRTARAYHAFLWVGTTTTAAWPSFRMPVPFRIDRGIVKTVPDLLPVVREGMLAWNDVDGTYAGTMEHGWTRVATSLEAVMRSEALDLNDGIAEISVDFTTEVFDYLGIDAELIRGIGVTEVTSMGIVTDGFVLLNGAFELHMYPIQGRETVAHEVGHVLSLGHSGITDLFIARESDAFPTMSGPNVGVIFSADDIAGISALYPECDFEARFGAITGEVRDAAGNGTQAVSITAVSRNLDTLVGHLTGTLDTDGTYFIAGVPPGEYAVYIEPLDGTRIGAGSTPENIDVAFTNPSTSFPVEGFDDVPLGSGQETFVTVEAGRTVTGVSFVLGNSSPAFPAPVSVDGAAPRFNLDGPNNNMPLGGVPLAAIEVEATTVLVATAVAFDATGSRSCAGDIVSWLWDFDDGAPQVEGATVSHTFASVGQFEVLVIVEDAAGGAANHVLTIAVVSELPPDPDPPGCGCRLASAGGNDSPWVAALVAVALLVLVAMRRRGRSPGPLVTPG